MKIFKHRFAIMLGTALLVPMVIVVSMTSANKAPTVVFSDDKNTPVILASTPAKVANLVSRQPETLPVPCPICMLNEMIGQNKKTSESTDGGQRNPRLVPAAIWFMQKFSEALRQPL